MSTSTVQAMTPAQAIEEGKRRIRAHIAELREAGADAELIEDLESNVEDLDEIVWDEEPESIELLAALLGVKIARS
jgi:hypothetical protein